MVKHSETICRQKLTNVLSLFDHFMELALKGLLKGIILIWLDSKIIASSKLVFFYIIFFKEILLILLLVTAQKMKFSITDFLIFCVVSVPETPLLTLTM